MPGFRVNTVNFGSEQFDTSTPMAVDFSRTSKPPAIVKLQSENENCGNGVVDYRNVATD